MELDINVFQKKKHYYCSAEAKHDLRYLKALRETVSLPQVWDTSRHFEFTVIDNDGYVILDNLYLQYDLVRSVFKNDDEILESSTLDKEWAEKRNEDLLEPYYQKVTVSPEAQEKFRKTIDSIIPVVQNAYDTLHEAEIREKQARDALFAKFTRIKTYKNIKPWGDETKGQDGYIDADYKSDIGEVIRFVWRNVFDFGTYGYPKRFEGTDDVFSLDKWTDQEKVLNHWLSTFEHFVRFEKNPYRDRCR